MAEQQQEVTNRESRKVAPEFEILSVEPILKVEAPKAEDAIQFYKAVFGAVELERFTHPKRKAEQERPYIGFAKLKIGTSTVLVSDCVDDAGVPLKVEVPGNVSFCFNTDEDLQATVGKAVQAGAATVGDITSDDFCFGPDQRLARIRDPFGFLWIITGSTTKDTLKSEDPATATTITTV